MIKKLIIGVFLLMTCVQIMTDEQVMQYVLSETQKGTSQTEIVTKLMSQGVSIEQIQRLRAKYTKETDGSSLGAQDLTGTSRLRRNNGIGTQQEESAFMRKGNGLAQPDINSMSTLQRQQYIQQQQSLYLNGLGFVLPDSMSMYGSFQQYESTNIKRIFGHDIFSQKLLTFEPEMNIPAPADYLLGAGDLVFIAIFL